MVVSLVSCGVPFQKEYVIKGIITFVFVQCTFTDVNIYYKNE